MNEASDILNMSDVIGQQAPLLLCAVPLFALFYTVVSEVIYLVTLDALVAIGVLGVALVSVKRPSLLGIKAKWAQIMRAICRLKFRAQSMHAYTFSRPKGEISLR